MRRVTSRHRPSFGVNDLVIPESLRQACDAENRAGWLASLPEVIATVAHRWSVTVGKPFQPGGRTAWVAPVVGATGESLVLKLGWRHPEAEDEAAGLRAWGSDGAVRVHADDQMGETNALLLERCLPGGALSKEPEAVQDVVVAGLLRRLWRNPGLDHGFRALAEMCAQWADSFERRMAAGEVCLDPGVAAAGVAVLRSLPGDTDRQVVLAIDLHAGNVLAATREPWLVIDPKPHVGDPTFDVVQHLLNCEERLIADPQDLVKRMAELVDLDADRLLRWLFARCVSESADRPALGVLARRLAPAALG